MEDLKKNAPMQNILTLTISKEKKIKSKFNIQIRKREVNYIFITIYNRSDTLFYLLAELFRMAKFIAGHLKFVVFAIGQLKNAYLL